MVGRFTRNRTSNRESAHRLLNSEAMSNQARIDDMTMQIKVRSHPDRARAASDPRPAARDLRDPREEKTSPPFGFSSPRRRDAAGRPRPDSRLPLPNTQDAHLRVGSGFRQFPPQRPFAQPAHVQPPTVSVRSMEHFSQVFAGFSPRPGIGRRGPRPPARRRVSGPDVGARSHPRSSRGDYHREGPTPQSHRHRACHSGSAPPARSDPR